MLEGVNMKAKGLKLEGIVEQKLEYERDGVKVSCIQYSKKAPDGTFYEDGDLIDQNLLIRQDAYRKAAGLLTSEDIKAIRSRYHLGQKDFARILGIGEIDIVRYETKAVQTKAINDTILRAKTDPVWFQEKVANAKGLLAEAKIKEVNKAIADYVQSDEMKAINARRNVAIIYPPCEPLNETNGKKALDFDAIISITAIAFGLCKRSLTKTKLAKFLYFVDAEHYRKFGRGLTGLVYVHATYGALPKGFDAVLALPEFQVQECPLDSEEEAFYYSIKTTAKNTFDPATTAFVKQVLSQYADMATGQVVSIMHQEKAFTETRLGQIINY